MNRIESSSPWPDPQALGGLTDLYQLTMAAGWYAAGRTDQPAVFEVFARRRPEHRAYLVMAGLEAAIEAILALRFDREQVAAIRALPIFAGVPDDWFGWLERFRFRGDVWAIPEGTVVFAGEPLVRVEAPIVEAQLLETLLLALLAYPISVASKAARIVAAADGRPVYELGARRGHTPQAGLVCARSAYLAGFAGTSLVEAGLRLGIPLIGTMAHSWVQSYDHEDDAFRQFAALFPAATTALVDTFDIERGTRRAAAIDPPIRAIRIDSGDLAAGSRRARAILDAMGRESVKILVSNDLDEDAIAELLAAGAPIDGFGVGTELITVRDAPALSLVYKLVERNGVGCVKTSAGKGTYPQAKQVVRTRDAEGRLVGDRVVGINEPGADAGLLIPVVRNGERVADWPHLAVIRDHAAREIASLPDEWRRRDGNPNDPVAFSATLTAARDRARETESGLDRGRGG